MELDRELVETLADRSEERLTGSLQRRLRRPEELAQYLIHLGITLAWQGALRACRIGQGPSPDRGHTSRRG
jgi:hypothetical protein